jgi:hypothetical protein
MTVKTTTWEIWGVTDGKVGNYPCDTCVSLKHAEKESAYRARGDLLDTFHNRKPSKPIFVLGDDEVLRDGLPDGLYIRKKVSISEPQYSG